MKRTHLLVVLIGFAAVSILAADASAMYHPGMGRFMQRDPIGQPVAYYAVLVEDGDSRFLPRDPATSEITGLPREPTQDAVAAAQAKIQARLGTGQASHPYLWQYADGMNLYAYAKQSPIGLTDPSGEVIPQLVMALIVRAAACITIPNGWMQARKDWTNDKYAHCVVSCQIDKACGPLVARIAGYGKEARDELVKRLKEKGVGWDPADIAANKDGYDCSPSMWGSPASVGKLIRREL